LTGDNRFVDEVERIAGLRIERRGQGRPRALTENQIWPLFSTG
jgi:putative transposase